MSRSRFVYRVVVVEVVTDLLLPLGPVTLRWAVLVPFSRVTFPAVVAVWPAGPVTVRADSRPDSVLRSVPVFETVRPLPVVVVTDRRRAPLSA